MLAVFAAGLIGYALGGWLGVAVGACSATAVSVLLEPLTPPGDRFTAHERRMRKNRRYRVRYEALEESWRTPYRQTQRTNWKAVNRRVAEGRAVERTVPIEIVPLPNTIEELVAPAAAAALEVPALTPKRKRAEATAPAAAPPKKPKATTAPKPATARKPSTARKPRTPRSTGTPVAKPI